MKTRRLICFLLTVVFASVMMGNVWAVPGDMTFEETEIITTEGKI